MTYPNLICSELLLEETSDSEQTDVEGENLQTDVEGENLEIEKYELADGEVVHDGCHVIMCRYHNIIYMFHYKGPILKYSTKTLGHGKPFNDYNEVLIFRGFTYVLNQRTVKIFRNK